MAKSVLGKGVSALFNMEDAKALGSGNDVSRETSLVRLALVEPNRQQPRKEFEATALEELADSILKYGILQPLLVRKTGATYQIIAGERRWRAARLAGLTEVPVIVRDFSDSQAAEAALIENLQREDLNPVEEAMAYRSLIEDFGLKQEEVAERVSKNRSTVTNSLRLLQLGEDLLQKLSEGKLSAGHARALLSVSDEKKRAALADQIIRENLSVREAERLSKKTETASGGVKTKKKADEYLKEAEKQLTRSLGTKVCIRPGTDGAGRIEISYYSLESLNTLLERLR